MSRKVFISFLGYTNYGACYYCKDDYKSQNVRYIQEATIDYINTLNPWHDNDVALILLTKGAEKKNWDDNGHVDSKTNVTIIADGLCSRLEKMNLPLQIKPVKDLPDGNNENEIWDIFSRVYGELYDGDEVYFDLTHSFRYLPMLILVLGNYAKFLKNITVRHLYYGNYEGRNKDTCEAQIIDLLPLSSLQDWTFAAGQYLEDGNIDRIAELCNAELSPIIRDLYLSQANADKEKTLKTYIEMLKDVINDMRTCRGINIVEGSNIAKMKDYASKVTGVNISPLYPILKRITEELQSFDSVISTQNGFEAAEWCFKKGLYQQAITILRENVVTHLCMQEGLDWKSENERKVIDTALFSVISNEKRKNNVDDNKAVFDEKVSKAKENDTLKKVAIIMRSIRDIRNDYNHSGINDKPVPALKLIKKVGSKIDDIKEEITTPMSLLHKEKESFFVNISNHPSDQWGEEQKKAASFYGTIVDYAFPNISPSQTAEEIGNLAYTIYLDIMNTYRDCNITIHLMGEFTMTYALLNRFVDAGIKCVASTTERIIKEFGDGRKESVFNFVQFREYDS